MTREIFKVLKKDINESKALSQTSVLIGEGFKREPIMWSFTPKFYHKDDGYYFSKFIPSEVDGTYCDEIEVGVIINKEYNLMEVYMCACVVGCCGRDLGIHPFSLTKIEELLVEERKRLSE